MDLYVDNIYEPILTGAQLQDILSSICNLLYKCIDSRGVCKYMYMCLCVCIHIFKDKASHQLCQLKKRVSFLCLHCLFAYLYIVFQSLYNKNGISSTWCVYFPKVPFILLF